MKRLIVLAILLTACGSGDPAPTTAADESAVSASATAMEGPAAITPEGDRIALEVASTPTVRARGLMFRDQLPRGRGMIFIFPTEEVQGFWMKNTLIPLDMIWIDSGGTIVHIEQRVPPCEADPCPTYSASTRAKYVLELAGGEVEHFGLETGDRLTLEGLESFRVE